MYTLGLITLLGSNFLYISTSIKLYEEFSLTNPGVSISVSLSFNLILIHSSVVLGKLLVVILPLLPLIATFVCCINAPTILYNTRYVFPIIFSIFPLLLFYFAKIFTNDENE